MAQLQLGSESRSGFLVSGALICAQHRWSCGRGQGRGICRRRGIVGAIQIDWGVQSDS